MSAAVALPSPAVDASHADAKAHDATANTSAALASASSGSPTASPATRPNTSYLVDGKEHQLETVWTLYYDKKLPKPADYVSFEQNLLHLGRFNTLEGFWRHFAFLTPPDRLPRDHNISMFRHSYIPAWESFPNGGCWIVKVRKHNGLITRLWEELCFAAIGELFEEPQIVGVVLSTRTREDFLSVWNRDNVRYPDVRFKIGEKLRDILNLDPSTQVEYKHFATSLKDGSTYRNAKPYVYAAQPDKADQEQ